MNWQGQLTSLALSYSHTIASGGGLIGAVQIGQREASVHAAADHEDAERIRVRADTPE